MKTKLLIILLFTILILSSCSKTNEISKELQDKNKNLEIAIAQLQKTNNDLRKSLKKESEKNKELSSELKQREEGLKYLDTIVEGKETLTTYENIVLYR